MLEYITYESSNLTCFLKVCFTLLYYMYIYMCVCVYRTLAVDALSDNGMIFLGLLVLIGFNVVYALAAAILVAIEVYLHLMY